MKRGVDFSTEPKKRQKLHQKITVSQKAHLHNRARGRENVRVKLRLFVVRGHLDARLMQRREVPRWSVASMKTCKG
jgi:hypothetical protein